jgi:phosphomannomutase/phosphoglucomutase
LMVLNMLVELQKDIESLCQEIPSYFITDDIRIKLAVEKRSEFFRKVKEDVSKKNFRLDLNDGIKAYTKDNSWALLRQSITEPLLSLRFEVKEKDHLLPLVESFLESVPELKEIVISKIYAMPCMKVSLTDGKENGKI